MISNTANGLPLAVSAKPLADDRDERFIVVIFHDMPRFLAETTSIPSLLHPVSACVILLRPIAPKIPTVVGLAPFTSPRGWRHVVVTFFSTFANFDPRFGHARTPRFDALRSN